MGALLAVMMAVLGRRAGGVGRIPFRHAMDHLSHGDVYCWPRLPDRACGDAVGL